MSLLIYEGLEMLKGGNTMISNKNVLSAATISRWKKGKQVKPGRVTHKEMHHWVDGRGVVLRGGDLDESPQVYRRLPDVLAAQGGTVEILHTLRPLIVCMAPGNTFDPFRD